MWLATSQQVDQFRTDLNNVVAIARAELRAFWNGLDKSDPVYAQSELVGFMQDLNDQYGSVSSTVAADWFDEIRETSNVPGVFRSFAADAVPAVQVAGSTGWALSTSDGLAALLGVSDRLIKQAGRDTIAFNVDRDARASYARVPRGDTCAFCLMLASRGPVYGSKRSAGEGNKYHSDCDCVAVPIYRDTDLPSGYDPRKLSEVYAKGVAEAGTSNTKQVLAGIRTVTGSH